MIVLAMTTRAIPTHEKCIFLQEVSMRIAVFGAKNYERRLLDELNARHKHEIVYFEPLLGPDTGRRISGGRRLRE